MALYAFTTATFTPGGATGQNGPSLAQAQAGLTGPETAVWKNDINYFNTLGGIQLWTVPKSGVYRVEAWGAQGGNPTGKIGGKGARMRGDVELVQGQIVRILVGQQGQIGGHSQNTSQSVTAGGGGSFVVKSPYNTLASVLVVAGGGGGGANNTWSVADGRPAVITTTGNSGQGGTAGGIDGLGGATDGNASGGGGAGFFGDGPALSGTPLSDVSKAFVNGGTGGRNARTWSGPEIWGGFGGGGGGGGLAAGGGGGYSGGGSGSWSSLQAGGGGGSFNSGINQDNTGDVKTGNGEVVVTYMSELPSGLRTSVTRAGQGDTVSFELTLRGAIDGDIVPYTITGVTTSNINGAALTGNITIVNEIGVLVIVTSPAAQPIDLTLTVSMAGFTSSIALTYLISGTQPAIGGTVALNNAVAVAPGAEIDIAPSVSQTGIFVYSSARSIISSVATSTPEVLISAAAGLSQTGIFVYAAARPVLTGFTGLSLGQPGSGPAVSSAPVTRQILIR